MRNKQWTKQQKASIQNQAFERNLDPVVQSIVSLTSSLVVKMLTVLVSAISNSQVFFTEKNVGKCKSYSHFFSTNISIYAIFNDQTFNDTLTNDNVCFEQLDPGSVMFFSLSLYSFW